MKEKGIIVKIKGSACIVLTKAGTYKKVPLAGHQKARVGSEIEFSPVNWLSSVKPALMVASILILVLGLNIFRGVMTPEAFAYVALDINPSIELAVSKDFKVVGVNPLNPDAEELLKSMHLKGSDLYSSIDAILAKSEQQGYLKRGEKNYVLSTITLSNITTADSQAAPAVDYDSFASKLEASIDNKDVDIEVMIMTTDKTMRAEAKKQGLSAGKLALYKEAAKSGQQISLDQVKSTSVTKLVNIYQIKSLPNNKKVIIKSLHLPPGHLKKAEKAADKIQGRTEHKDAQRDDEADQDKQNQGIKHDKEGQEKGNWQDRVSNHEGAEKGLKDKDDNASSLEEGDNSQNQGKNPKGHDNTKERQDKDENKNKNKSQSKNRVPTSGD